MNIRFVGLVEVDSGYTTSSFTMRCVEDCTISVSLQLAILRCTASLHFVAIPLFSTCIEPYSTEQTNDTLPSVAPGLPKLNQVVLKSTESEPHTSYIDCIDCNGSSPL
nr:hypothetical protein BgiMline_020557 [Biomphalaria glabrata]